VITLQNVPIGYSIRGVGTDPFAAAVQRVCESEDWSIPTGFAVDTNPEHLSKARDRNLENIEFRELDFLSAEMLEKGSFDYIVGNPPYVPIEGLDEDEKQQYKREFTTAIERFDLYLLFFERSLSLLADGGVMSFVTPEKFEYVDTAAPLRRLLTNGVHIEEIEHLDEDSFTGLVTFPCITTLRCDSGSSEETIVTLRDGSTHETMLPTDGSSWAPNIRGADVADLETGATLDDVTVRISCGIATGADRVFVFDQNELPEDIDSKWVRRTVSGRQLQELDSPYTDKMFVCPYRDDGSLPDEDELGTFGDWATGASRTFRGSVLRKKAGKEMVRLARKSTTAGYPPAEDCLERYRQGTQILGRKRG
jgi:Methylase of polypeptide chain release factors